MFTFYINTVKQPQINLTLWMDRSNHIKLSEYGNFIFEEKNCLIYEHFYSVLLPVDKCLHHYALIFFKCLKS